MEKREKVSVVLASYNGEKYIEEQVKSILDNLQENDELIISDDGSTDNTLKVINNICDNRIRILKGPKQGLKKNFENAIKNASGEYIFLSDQDDIWMRNKVDTVLKYFESNPKLILIQHDAIVIDENHNVLFPSFAEHRKVKTGVIKNLIKNSYHGCCMAFKKELVDEIIPIPEYIYLHDEWIGIIAELNGETTFIEEKLIKYRRHSQNASSFKHLSVGEMIKNRYNYTKAIIKYKINGAK